MLIIDAEKRSQSVHINRSNRARQFDFLHMSWAVAKTGGWAFKSITVSCANSTSTPHCISPQPGSIDAITT